MERITGKEPPARPQCPCMVAWFLELSPKLRSFVVFHVGISDGGAGSLVKLGEAEEWLEQGMHIDLW